VTVDIAPDLRTFVCLGVLVLEDAHIVEQDARLDAPLVQAAEKLRAQPPPEEDTAATRALYKRFGIDPTKTRPASEALLRRVRKGDAIPRINTLVDVINWCSVELQLPYGLYDVARIHGGVELRRGRAGESYSGIRKDDVHLEGRPTLTDADGPFGNPTSDSARTMVTTATDTAMVVIFAPRDRRARLEHALDLTASRAATFAGARTTDRRIVE
jgi:DNA/RNA-binding domain of Phe-tRNA-synthetase-like protein